MTYPLRHLIAACVVTGAAILTAPAFAAEDNPKAIGTVLARTVEDFIRPGYAALHARAEAAHAATAALCDEPSQRTLDAARDAFAGLVDGWSEIEIIRFGPVVADNRLERILFFPDRRGIGLRQVQAVLAEKDETATDPTDLAAKSVALQGLTTLEYLLYGTGAEKLATAEAGFRCRFAEAVTVRLSETAGEIEAAWAAPDGIARHFAEPDAAYPDFRTEKESLQALLGVFVNSSELVADTRLKPFLGPSADEATPKRAIFWRAGLTAASIDANLAGLEKLFAASDMMSLVPAGTARYGHSAMFEIANARRLLGTVEGPLGEAAADPESRGLAEYPRIVLLSVRDTFNGRIASGLGLSAGFSSLDGD